MCPEIGKYVILFNVRLNNLISCLSRLISGSKKASFLNQIQRCGVMDLLTMLPLTSYLFFLEQILNTLGSFLAFSCEGPEYLRPSPLSWKRQIPFSSTICFNLAFFFCLKLPSPLALFPVFPPYTFLFVFLLISLCPYSIASHLSAHPSEARSHQIYPLLHFTPVIRSASRLQTTGANLGCAWDAPLGRIHTIQDE